jgi:5-methylcytosine-specific restriction endonuclease McrA
MSKRNKSLVKLLKKRQMRISWKIRSESMSDNELVAHLHINSDMFLRSNQWRELRKKAIEIYGNSCLKCGKEGNENSPINLDHIKPRKFFPELALDINNLQPLCSSCNKNKGNGQPIDYR